ncbi:MAG TPA: rod shape-determining protein RodA [Chloroflexota bacterium]|nr:rod shape-determining protein RodA [Chloroflexota bacterium]
MLRARFWRQIDYLLLLAIAGLVGYGLMMIHSATCSPSCENLLPPTSWATRQALYAAAGLCAMVLTASIHYKVYRSLAYTAYFGALVLLVAVLLFGSGDVEYGARRWIRLGLFDLQASEVTKIALILTLARFLTDRDGPLSFRRTIASAFLLLPPLVLVYMEPNLGTALLFIFLWFGLIVMAGARPLHIGIIVLAAVLAAPGGWMLMREYQRARIETFFATVMNPENDPFGEGYNILQARISIGSGGMFGQGWLQGTQTQLDYLRVKQSDFIFSVLAEEMGFIGAMVLFALFIVLLFRVMRVVDKAPDGFARVVAFGVGWVVLFQAFVNLGANLTVLPVTGVPLPLVSFGGSSMLTFLTSFGILQSILIRSQKRRFSLSSR